MKKLKLCALELGASEILSREQMKKVLGGDDGSLGSKCKTGACTLMITCSGGSSVTLNGTCAGGDPSIPGSFWDVVGSFFSDTSSACYCSVSNITAGSVNYNGLSHCTVGN